MSAAGSGGRSRLHSYLQLLRPPNLFTVPGDPLCGALLASHGKWSWIIVPAIVASLSCYCIGLTLNDLIDQEEDRRDRPTRPIPSGAVSAKEAGNLILALLVIALGASLLLGRSANVTVLLLLLILAYTVAKKEMPRLAPFLMGSCRGASVLVGVRAMGPTHISSLMIQPFFPAHRFPPVNMGPLYAAAFITAYIAAVTVLARTETRDPRIPPLIGLLIRGLLFIQAGFCFLAGGLGWIASLLLLALWPLSRLVAKRFYAS